MIEFDAVTKVFPGGSLAVENLSLIAPTGRITVVVGPTGCGKTTLLRMVNRLVDPSAGRVLIDGAVNTQLRRSALRRSIGYVIAGGGLFPHRTVVENIETVPVLIGTRHRQARDLAHALLERVGLSETFADKYPGQLSTGQQLRVALARALAADPPILLLDEPFSTLDPVVRGDLQDDLLDLQQAAPKTILFVTHDIDEAIKLGDQIAVMDTGGRLVQIATPETLLVHPGTDFVADFLGRDRGIRKLAFLPASDLPMTQAVTVQAGATGDRARAISDQTGQQWLLVLDPDRHPRGWVDTAKLAATDVVSGPVVYPLGGTFYPDESVLAALDAAILSPPGLAVCIDDDGLVVGVVSHGDVARHLSTSGPALQPAPGAPAQPGAARPAAAAPSPRLSPASSPARAAEREPEPDPDDEVTATLRPTSPPASAPAPRSQPLTKPTPPAAAPRPAAPRPAAPAEPPVAPARRPAEPTPVAAITQPQVAAAAPNVPPVATPQVATQQPPPAPAPVPAGPPAAPPPTPAPPAPSISRVRPADPVPAPVVATPVAPTPVAPAPVAPASVQPAAQSAAQPAGGPAHAAPAQSAAAAAAASAATSAEEDIDSGRWEWDAATAQWVRVPSDPGTGS